MGGGHSAPGAASVFVGRARELDAIRQAMNSASNGVGTVVLVAGEPGVGKTRLLEEVTTRHDGAVVWATCLQGDAAPPFWPWVQVLRACADGGTLAEAGAGAADVRVLVDGGSGATDDSSRFRLFEGVTAVLAAAATAVSPAPFVVVLDDLQWADEASLHLLRFVAAEVGRLPVVVVGTYRDTEVTAGLPLVEAVEDLARSGVHLTLRGLGPDDLVALVRSVAGPRVDVDEQLGNVLHVQTGGNPLFARELTRLLDVEGRLGCELTGELKVVPGGIRAVIARRLARLPQHTEVLLSWAALVGATFDAAVLAAATRREPRDVLADLDPAVAAGIIVPADVGAFRFVHDLVREVLVSSTGLAERATRHRVLGEVMARTAGDDAERITRVAGHLVAGAPVGDADEAVRWAVRAAEQASATLAYGDAARWYERAIATRRAVAAGDHEDATLLLALGGARLDAGDLPAARDAFAAAAALARSRHDAEQLAAAALGLGAGFGGFEIPLFDQVQIDLLDEALTVLPPGDSSLRGWLLARLSVALAFVATSERRAEVSDEAVAMAQRIGDDVALGYALAGWCDAFSGPDDVDRRLAAAEKSVSLAVASRRRELELLGRRMRIVALLERGRLTDAATEVNAFARSAEALRQPLYRWYVPLWRSTLAMTEGGFAEAARWTDEAQRLGTLAHSENARILVAVQRIVRLRYEARFGDAAEVARGLLGDVPDVAAPGALDGSYLVGDVICGEIDRARRRADRLGGTGLGGPRADSEWLANAAQLADASVTLGHRGLAAAVHDALEPYAELFVVEGIGAAVCGAVAHYLALCATVLGRGRQAERFAASAEELHRSAGLFVAPPPLTATVTTARADTRPAVGLLRLEGQFWALTYLDATVRLRDSKGLRDLAVLLRSPGRAVHVSELTGAPATTDQPDLDSTAVAAYRRRLAELEEDMSAAESDHDTHRSEKLGVERDFLVAELTGALGLGGRPRRSGEPVERARKAVTARIRDSIARISAVHPQLGRHLTNAVRTGTWCSYQPEQRVDWRS